MDISLAVAIVVAGALYVLLALLFPEPRAVYGPDGPRWLRASDAEVPAIEGRLKPAAGNPEVTT